MIFDPELGKEYEYSNDLNLDNEGSCDYDEKEKDKTYIEISKCCWISIKNILNNIFTSPIKYLIKYNHKNNNKKV